MSNSDYILSIIKTHKGELQRFGVKDIGLFGSYARGEQNVNSDIDILVDFFEDKESFDNLMGLYDFLEKIFQNEKIEVVTKNGLSPYIGPRILQEVIYA